MGKQSCFQLVAEDVLVGEIVWTTALAAPASLAFAETLAIADTMLRGRNSSISDYATRTPIVGNAHTGDFPMSSRVLDLGRRD